MTSKLDYASYLYDSADKILDILDKVQNKCLRIITGAVQCTRIEKLHVEAAIETLSDRRRLLSLYQLINISTNEHPCGYLLRNADIYNLSSHKPFSTRVLDLSRELSLPFDRLENKKKVYNQEWNEYKK